MHFLLTEHSIPRDRAFSPWDRVLGPGTEHVVPGTEDKVPMDRAYGS